MPTLYIIRGLPGSGKSIHSVPDEVVREMAKRWARARVVAQAGCLAIDNLLVNFIYD